MSKKNQKLITNDILRQAVIGSFTSRLHDEEPRYVRC